jgi:hypothetical protein
MQANAPCQGRRRGCSWLVEAATTGGAVASGVMRQRVVALAGTRRSWQEVLLGRWHEHLERDGVFPATRDSGPGPSG